MDSTLSGVDASMVGRSTDGHSLSYSPVVIAVVSSTVRPYLKVLTPLNFKVTDTINPFTIASLSNGLVLA